VNDKTIILGIGINTLPLNDLLINIEKIIQDQRRVVIAYANAHALNLAWKNARFANFLNTAEIVFCDGFGVRLAAQLLGRTVPARFTPPDWIGQLADLCVRQGHRMYFLGAQPGVAEKAADHLRKTYPGLDICGVQHGYFNTTDEGLDDDEVITEINRLAPQVLVVGLGMPAQEFWIEDHWSELKVNIALPVGAMFDYISGETPRAPRWMTDHGLEWLGRLIIEPRRLWKRYMIGNPHFILMVMRELISKKKNTKRGLEC